MSESATTERRSAPSADVQRARVRRLLGLSLICLACQVSLTDYGASGSGGAVLWFALGCWLIWMVASRRSSVARGLIVVTSLVGAAIYGAVALGADIHAAMIALAFLGQAVPLLAGPVREHVRRTR